MASLLRSALHRNLSPLGTTDSDDVLKLQLRILMKIIP